MKIFSQRRPGIGLLAAASILALASLACAALQRNARPQAPPEPIEATEPGVPAANLTPEAGSEGVAGEQSLGEEIPIASADHIEEGSQASDWNSDPPTSGQHYPRWVEAGFYENIIPDGYLIHNMEHGYVIIYYNCSGLTTPECDQFHLEIQAAMAEAGNDPNTQTPKMIAVPRPQMDNPITYASWGRLYAAENFQPGELVLFVDLYRSQAPEGSLP